MRGVNWLTAYVPGQRHSALPPGTARRIPAGSKFVFQMHYTPNGHAQQDNTRVGMVFVEPESVENEIITLIALNQEFEIPPHATDHLVTAQVPELPAGAQLLAVSPHMHVRGKSFQVFSQVGDQRKLLLDVPRYDFNWQHTYEFSEPLALDSVESLQIVARFDNSAGNPVNPDPSATVTWGDQTWEEMAVAFFEVSQPLNRQLEPLADVAAAHHQDEPEPTLESPAARKYADDFLKALDRDGDGRVAHAEAPLSVKHYSFGFFDANRDKQIDRDELLRAYRQGRK